MVVDYRCSGEHACVLVVYCVKLSPQYVTGAAQGVDASRVVFAFARSVRPKDSLT